jgi:hypothetical protein
MRTWRTPAPIYQRISAPRRGVEEMRTAVLYLVVVAAFILWLTQPDWFMRRLMGAAGVPSDRVYMQKRPIDCDFLTAPVGIKGCSYVRHRQLLTKEGGEWTPDTIAPGAPANCYRYPLAECPRVPIDSVSIYWEKQQK